jgi:hypothetical protein
MVYFWHWRSGTILVRNVDNVYDTVCEIFWGCQQSLSDVWLLRYQSKAKRSSCLCKITYRTIGVWDDEYPTFSIQAAHSWRWGCQSYVSATHPLPLGRFLVLISVRLTRPEGRSEAGRNRSIEKADNLIANRTSELLPRSRVPQPTTGT